MKYSVRKRTREPERERQEWGGREQLCKRGVGQQTIPRTHVREWKPHTAVQQPQQQSKTRGGQDSGSRAWSSRPPKRSATPTYGCKNKNRSLEHLIRLSQVNKTIFLLDRQERGGLKQDQRTAPQANQPAGVVKEVNHLLFLERVLDA